MKHVAVAIIGAIMKTTLSAAAGIMSSFRASFTPSESDCKRPNLPTRLGPVRNCIFASTRRSVHTAMSVETTQMAKTIKAFIAIIQPGSFPRSSAVVMPSPP